MKVIVGGIIEKDGKYLLVQEAQEKAYKKWNFPAGHLDFNESLKEGAIREIKEETGLVIANPQLYDVIANVHMIYPNQDEVYYTDVVYVVTDYTGTLSHDAESTELKWFPINELPENIMQTQIAYITRFVQPLIK